MDLDRLEFELRYHPGQTFVSYLISGLRNGFDTMVPSVTLPNKVCRNLLSATQNSGTVCDLFETECKNGFVYGPLEHSPFKHYRVSPLGVAVGKYLGKKRLIVDLSSPHDDLRTVSINELIDKDSCSLSYVRLDDAIQAIRKCEKEHF